MNIKKAAFYTLGCKLNYSETSALSRTMADNGFSIVPFQSAADVYVINTCSVTDHADKKCRKIVKQALKHAPQAYIVIVGCYAQLKPKEISEIPGVDLVLGAAEKFNLAEHLKELTKSKTGKYIAGHISDVHVFNTAYSLGERTRTFLKVQDGCDYSCSFCTIPLARGKSRSDTINHVVKTAEDIAKQGCVEIVLTGVNIGDFGTKNNEEKETFFDLICALDLVENIERFRISSIEPNLLLPEIIQFVSNSKKFVPHFHIPLQSGSNKILKLMRRRYLRELYSERIALIKKLMPHCCIGVDVITGFPGETHEDFLETYHFINALDVSYLHVFTYSERANTHALELSDIVPQNIREQRTTQLRNLSEKKRRFFYNQFIHTSRPVLFESEIEGDMMYGYTDNYVRVKTTYDPMLVNEITEVYLQEIDASSEIVTCSTEQAFASHH